MRIILVLFVTLFCFSFNKSYFAYETFNAYLNREKIGHWGLLQSRAPEKIIVDFKNDTDTLMFCGYSDCGALDGTILKIKYQDSLILKLTRISRSGILRHDTVTMPKPGEKLTFELDHGVTFYATS